MTNHSHLNTSHTHLIRLDLGGNSSVVDDLRGQEVKLDVGVCDVWPTADETSTLQVGCCSITYGTVIMVSEKVGHCVMCVPHDHTADTSYCVL